MLKKSITYTDYNGTERTEDFYFNFNKAELIEMETSVNGGLSQIIENVSKTSDVPELMKIFKKLVLDAYGEKSADGKRFIKSEQLRTEFEQTEAYSQLFVELATNSDAAVEFFNGIIPKNLQGDTSALKRVK